MNPIIPYPIKELDEFTLSEKDTPTDDTQSSPIAGKSWGESEPTSPRRPKVKLEKNMQVLNHTARRMFNPFAKTNAKKISKKDDSFIRVTPRVQPAKMTIEDEITLIDTGDKIVKSKMRTKRREGSRPEVRAHDDLHIQNRQRKTLALRQNIDESKIPIVQQEHSHRFSDTDIPLIGSLLQTIDTTIDNGIPQLSPFKKIIKVSLLIIVIIQVNVLTGYLTEYVKSLAGLN